jgi:DNA-binding MarR family transcriptional regulator
MDLEKEINQKKFSNEYQKLAVNIIYTHGWLMNFQNKFFKKHDITAPQYNVLRILRGQHPNSASINLVKDRMLDKASDASRIVERLRVKGLVERVICDDDRRKVNVNITSKGLTVLSKMDHLEKELKGFLGNLNKQEAKELNNLLDKLRG